MPSKLLFILIYDEKRLVNLAMTVRIVSNRSLYPRLEIFSLL